MFLNRFVNINFQYEVRMHIKHYVEKSVEPETWDNPRGEINILFTLLDYYSVADFVKLNIISMH